MLPLADARTTRIIITILLFGVALAFIYAAWHVLVAFLFAIFFAYVVDPVVEFVARRTHLSRGKAIGIVYLGIFAGLALLFLFVGPRMVREGQKLAHTIPGLYEKIATGQIAWQVGAQHGWSYETKLKIQEFLQGHRQTILQQAQAFGARLAAIGKYAWWLVLVPILAVFFLKDGRKFGQAALEMFDRERQRDFAEGLLNDVHFMLAHYIRAQLTLAALAMGVYIGLLSILRVPYAFVLGIVGGFLEFIPVVGPLIAALLMIGVALGAGYGHVLVLALFLGAWRLVQDYVTAPKIMGGQLELHPLAALFGVLAGAEVGGIIGVYLSIPVMATVRIFWRRWRAYSRVGPGDVERATDFTPLPEAVQRQRSA